MLPLILRQLIPLACENVPFELWRKVTVVPFQHAPVHLIEASELHTYVIVLWLGSNGCSA